MRDILVSVVIGVVLLFALRSPRVGVYLWAWLAMMIPYRFAYGFARTLPYAQMTAIVTLFGLLVSKERRPFPFNSITVVQLLFIGWMSVTSLFGLNTAELIFAQWIHVLKIHVMLFATMLLIRGRVDIERLVWVITLSIAFFGVKGGIWTLLNGGGGRVWGPSGGVIEGNNEIGVALVVVIPFIYYLYQVSSSRWVRMGLLVCIGTSAVGILGTQSRGGLLALVAMAAFLGFKGKYPVRTTLILTVVISLAVMFMPESWSGRMDTIQGYQQDTSAMSRIYTWQTLWNCALDRPLVGAGFGTDNWTVFSRYAPIGGVGAYTAGGIFVAHSIYFQALGEHGFPGLFLYLLLGFVTWRKASAIANRTRNDPDFKDWAPLLMRMVQVSLVGFSVGGAFLTLVHFDLPYYIVCYVVLLDATLSEREKVTDVSVAGQPQAIG
jgi:probable O-glycosylation ligase (exosortase A-associated)